MLGLSRGLAVLVFVALVALGSAYLPPAHSFRIHETACQNTDFRV